jgi:hypothetical protein
MMMMPGVDQIGHGTEKLEMVGGDVNLGDVRFII